MKRKYIILLIILISFYFNIDKIFSLTISSDVTHTLSEKMKSCTAIEGYYACWFNNNDMGYRFTIIEKATNNRASGTKSVDYFATKDTWEEGKIYYYLDGSWGTISSLSTYYGGYKYSSNDGVANKKIERINLGRQQQVSSKEVGIFHGLSEMLDTLKTGGDLYNSILSKAGITSSEFVKKISGEDKYFILIEPIYVIGYTETYGSENFKFVLGTASEIAKFLYNEYKKESYRLYGLTVSFVPNLAYNLCSGSVCGSMAISACGKDTCYSTMKANLEKIYKYEGYAMTRVYAEDIAIKSKLKIYKQNNMNGHAISNVGFELYKGKNCVAGNKIDATYTNSSGHAIFSNLDAGSYSVKEFSTPGTYEIPNDLCVIKEVYIPENRTIEKNVSNTPTCQTVFNDLKNKKDMQERVSAFQKSGSKYRNLLNLNYETATQACSVPECEKKINTGCLSASSTKISDFNVNNVSCYNKTITVDGKTGYCRVEFDLLNNFDNINNFVFSPTYSFTAGVKKIEPGQMVIRRSNLNNIVAKGRIVETCFVYENFKTGSLPTEASKYENYVSDVKFGGKNLGVETDTEFNTSWGPPASASKYSVFTKKSGVNYKLNEIFVSKSDAKIVTSGFVNNISLGYGIISKLNEETGVKKYIDFSLEIKSFSLMASPSYIGNASACSYTLSPGLIDPEPKLEFRVIDTKNPFQSKDGNPRRVGKNWAMNYSGGTLIKPANISNFKNGNTDMRYDYTGDKIVNMLDYYAYLGSEIDSNCTTKNMSDNCLILGVMESTNNSYNKNNKRKPMYKITLTPDTILKIRDYNKEVIVYDDFNMKKVSGKYISNFLDELATGKVLGESVTGTFER